MRMVAMLNRLIRRPPVRTKSAFERTALLARNRSHTRTRTRTRPRPRFLFRVLVLYIALFPDDKQLLVPHVKRDWKFAFRDIKGEALA